MLLILACFIKLSKSHGSETIRKYIVRLNNWFSLSCQGKIPIAILVHSVFHHKLCPMLSNIQPLVLLSDIIVEHRECPDLPSLQPHKLISVIYVSFLIKTSKEASALFIDGMVLPKRNYLI